MVDKVRPASPIRQPGTQGVTESTPQRAASLDVDTLPVIDDGFGSRPGPLPGAPARGLDGTVSISNGSGTVVRLPGQSDDSPAYVLSAGHVIGRHPGPNEVVQNQPVEMTVRAYDENGEQRTLTATELVYATGDSTDLSIYRLRHTVAELIEMGITVNEIPREPAAVGESVELVSGKHRDVISGQVDGIVHELHEFGWTWDDVLRLSEGMQLRGGHSGSPLFRQGTNEVVGVANTVNEDGEMGTLDNPMELNELGAVSVRQHTAYAVPTHPISTCTSTDGNFDLSLPSCQLPQGTHGQASPVPLASTSTTQVIPNRPAATPAPVSTSRLRWLPDLPRLLTEPERAAADGVLAGEPFNMSEPQRTRLVNGTVPGNFLALLGEAEQISHNLRAAGLTALEDLGDDRYAYLAEQVLAHGGRLELILRDGGVAAVDNVAHVWRNSDNRPSSAAENTTEAIEFFLREGQSRSLLSRYASPRFVQTADFVRTTLNTEPVAYQVPDWDDAPRVLVDAYIRTLADASTRFDAGAMHELAEELATRDEVIRGNDLYLLLAITNTPWLREHVDSLLEDRSRGERALAEALLGGPPVTRNEGPLARARESLAANRAGLAENPDSSYWQTMVQGEQEWLDQVEAEFGERPPPETLSILTLVRSHLLRLALTDPANRIVLESEIRGALANDGLEQGGVVEMQDGRPVIRSVPTVELERENPFYMNAETHPLLRNGLFSYHVHALRRLFKADFADVGEVDAFSVFRDLVDRGVLHEDGTLANDSGDLDTALEISDPAVRAAVREVILNRAYSADASRYAGPSGERRQDDLYTADWFGVDQYGGADVVVTYLGAAAAEGTTGPAVNVDLYYVDRRTPDEPLARCVDHGTFLLPNDPTQ